MPPHGPADERMEIQKLLTGVHARVRGSGFRADKL